VGRISESCNIKSRAEVGAAVHYIKDYIDASHWKYNFIFWVHQHNHASEVDSKQRAADAVIAKASAKPGQGG
jgi:hypothetical protein